MSMTKKLTMLIVLLLSVAIVPNFALGFQENPPPSAPIIESTTDEASQPEVETVTNDVIAQNDDPLTGFGQVTGITLINANTDEDVLQLPDNYVVDLNANPYPINIRTDVTGDVGSVRAVIFTVENGVPTNFFIITDNTAPFTVLNSPDDDIAGIFPPAGEYFISVIAYEGANGRGTEIGTEVFTLFVEGNVPTNTAPIVPDRQLEVPRDSSIAFDINEGITDPDGDPLTINIALPPQNGTITDDPNSDNLIYTPTPGFVGTDTFVIRATDGALEDTGLVTVTVVQPLGLPLEITDLIVINAETDSDMFTITEGLQIDRVQLTMPASIRAETSGNTGSVLFSLVIDEGNGNLIQNNYPPDNDTPFTLLGENGEGDYLGALAPLGLYTLTVTPFSGPNGTGDAGETLVRNFSVTDSTINEPPIVNPEPLETFNDTAVTFSPAAWVTDPENDLLLYTLTTPPNNGNATGALDGSTATYTPAPGFMGTDSFVISVTDNTNTVPITVNVTVLQLPQVNSLTMFNAQNNVDLFNITDEMVIDRSQLPTQANLRANATGTLGSVQFSMTITAPDGTVTPRNFNPDNTAPFTPGAVPFNGTTISLGDYIVTTTPYTQTNAGGVMGTALVQSFTIVDSTIPQPPELPDRTLTTIVNQSVAFDISEGATDINGDALSFSVSTPPPNGNVTGDDVNLLYTPDLGFVGTDTFEIAAFDGTFTTTATVTVTVEDAPADVPTSLKFVLVDANTGQDLFDLQNGIVVDLSVVGTMLNIRVDVNNATTSVIFDQTFDDGEAVVVEEGMQLENLPPYAIAGDTNGRYRLWDVAQGTYTITANPFSGENGTGEAGNSATVTFNVVSNGALPEIDGFTLINAAADTDLFPITEGAVISLANVGNELNIRADANDKTNSVLLELYDADGNLVEIRAEQVAPFALAGDNSREGYKSWLPTPGAYTLKATPYADNNTDDGEGVRSSISFTVTE